VKKKIEKSKSSQKDGNEMLETDSNCRNSKQSENA